MLSCLVVAGSIFLSGPYEAIRLDDVQSLHLKDRTLRVYDGGHSETFEVTAYEAGRRPAQIVADCAARAELDHKRQELQAKTTSIINSAPQSLLLPALPLKITEGDVHSPTPLEAECEAEHYRYGARDVEMVREICAGSHADPGVPSDDRGEE